jgi:hypothetical protein
MWEDNTIRVCPDCGHPLQALERTDLTTTPCWECEGPDRHQFSHEEHLQAWFLPQGDPDSTR